jgi:hypothetical protein
MSTQSEGLKLYWSAQCTDAMLLSYFARRGCENPHPLNLAASLPTLERGQAIRGHYRAAGDELVIHARPCLALLHFYLGALPHVQHLRILGALYLWLSTSRSISRRQRQCGALAIYAASCRRHAQHATLPVPCTGMKQALCMLAQYVSDIY